MNPLSSEYDHWTGDPATDRALLKARILAAAPSARNEERIREERHCTCRDRDSFGRLKLLYHLHLLDSH